MRCGGFYNDYFITWYIFSADSDGERILKIGQYVKVMGKSRPRVSCFFLIHVVLRI